MHFSFFPCLFGKSPDFPNKINIPISRLFEDCLIPISSTHPTRTGKKDIFRTLLVKDGQLARSRKKAFSDIAPTLWNSLPPLLVFWKCIKTWLCQMTLVVQKCHAALGVIGGWKCSLYLLTLQLFLFVLNLIFNLQLTKVFASFGSFFL